MVEAARRLLRFAFLALPLAGCASAPAYKVPEVAAAPLPETYKEVGPWTPAAPADEAARGQWWTAFGDPLLDDLQGRLVKANPDLAAALARYDQSRALLSQARADLFPQVQANGGTTRERLSATRPLGQNRAATTYDIVAGGSVSYELDLWGRVRNEVAAGKAEAQASSADLASARLSLQAQLADSYLALRSLDAQAKVLDEATASYTKALSLTQARHDGGVVSGIDVGQAQTQLQTAKAAQSEVVAQRAIYEHAIASLVGEPAPAFSIPAAAALPAQPKTPVSTPSVLLQRRPDIAAAERRTYEANRRIGVARAAFYPTISLGATGGFETSSFAQSLLSTPASFWSLGPTAALALFDGGRRKAVEAQAKAVFDEAGANYRSTVLAAFQQVEDNLALLNRLAQETDQEQAAFEAAKRTEALAVTRYRQGATTYLDVVTAQATALDAQRATIVLQQRRLQASVDLVRALGGGWTTAEMTTAAVTPAPAG